LPAKHHDTWVVRAVYEGIAQECGVSIRPSDRLEKDLGYLDEDLDDLVREIAARAGRNIDVTQANPHFGKVVTVEDLVLFIEHQPSSQRVA